MSLGKIDKRSTTRRGFVKEVAASAAGVAVAGALRAALAPAHEGQVYLY